MRRLLTLLGVLVVFVGSSLAVGPVLAAASVAPDDLSQHPLVGTWLAMANPPRPGDPLVAAPAVFTADGTVSLVFPLSQIGLAGIEFTTAGVGTWEAVDHRQGHFTAIEVISDANGVFTGTVTIDGFPTVSEDGQTFLDDGSQAVITIRDASGKVLNVIGDNEPVQPVAATRMGVGQPGFLKPCSHGHPCDTGSESTLG